MKIAVIGTGEVGGTLGKLWAANGHSICFGSRDPDSARVRALVKTAGPRARAASSKEAAAFGDLVVLATPWPATRASIKACGPLRGKKILDCTNPFNDKTMEVKLDGPTGAAQVARWAGTQRVVKGFNTIGANLFGHPKFGGQKLTMYLCGDPGVKRVVRRLAEQLGFEVADCGPLKKARLLEALCGLWVTLAPQRRWKIAFRLVQR
jgi:predicted dinucleotide-binding enzyme